MLEYLFFGDEVADRFVVRLNELGLAFERGREPIEQATVIRIEEDAAEPYWDELDELYEVLSAADQAALEQSLDGLSVSGIYIQLGDGRRTVARVEPALLNRILSVISMDELNRLVEAITTAVENPDDGPLCGKQSGG